MLEIRGTLNGQPCTQYPQPMQLSLLKSTIPLLSLIIAPGLGHAFIQPGSSQCIQPSLRINQSIPPCSFSSSLKRITVHAAAPKSRGLSYTPSLVPISGRVSFHSIQATWQALQPIHLEISISFATLTALAASAGGVIVVAERATT